MIVSVKEANDSKIEITRWVMPPCHTYQISPKSVLAFRHWVQLFKCICKTQNTFLHVLKKTNISSEQIRGVLEFLQANKVFFDAPCTDKTPKDAHTTSFVVRTTGSGSAERLLADNCPCTLFVVVDVASRIAKSVRRLKKSYTILSEATSYEYKC